jgi:hypothetical protein
VPTYKTLKQKNPEWDGGYWRRVRALYAGGKKLLGDRDLLREVFPPHLAERKGVYDERCRRAYFIPYAGEIIDMITSALFSEELMMVGDPEPDLWYEGWAKDVSPPGGAKQNLRQFVKQQLTTALLCKRAWTLIDLPTISERADTDEPEPPPVTLAEQEARGLLDAYACGLDPECVWDWETDKEGALLWALVHYTEARRAGIDGNRDVVTEEWMYYTPVNWQKYAITYHKTTPPQDPTLVPLVAQGTHSFGRVPIIPLELTDGLWAMGKIESIAVAHFNKRNALSWAEYKSLFPVLTHFAGPPDPTNPLTDDPDRALNQTIGQGYVVQLGDKDRFEYVGPDTASYAVAQADLAILRDEMHRVVHQMAMSVDNSAAALQRSGTSKQVDQEAACVVLREFGKIVREHAVEMYELAQVGRQDPAPTAWSAQGMDDYDDLSVDSLVTTAQTMELISIPSATFQREWKFQLARRVLGDGASDEVLDDIRKELDTNISNEQFQAPALMAAGAIDVQDGEPVQQPGANGVPKNQPGAGQPS